MIAPTSHGGNGKRQPRDEAEHLAAIKHRAPGRITPKAVIPPAAMARMRRYFAALEEGLEPKPAAEKAGVSYSCVKTNGWWRARYTRFAALEAAAMEKGNAKMRAEIHTAMIDRGIVGIVETVRRKFNKDGSLAYEETVRKHSDRLLERLFDRYFPEFREAAGGPSVNVTVNAAEERREILVVVSDPEARAAIRRARDRALMSAGGAGEPGAGGDGPPPA